MARIKTQEQGRELVQATLGENISIIWDIDPHSPPVCPQNVIDLKQQLLCFSSLVPIEMVRYYLDI
jgi:hypothetical protein